MTGDAGFVLAALGAVLVSGGGIALYERIYWKRRKAREWPHIEAERERNIARFAAGLPVEEDPT